MGIAEPHIELMGGSLGANLIQYLHHPCPLSLRPSLDGGTSTNLVILLLDFGGPALCYQRGQLTKEEEKWEGLISSHDSENIKLELVS